MHLKLGIQTENPKSAMALCGTLAGITFIQPTQQLAFFKSNGAKTGAKTGVAALVALCTSLLKRSVRGGLVIVGDVNLGGSIETVHNPVSLAENAVEKGAVALLMPVSCRRQLIDLSDEMATKIDIQFYLDPRDAVLKAISDGH